MPKRKTDYELDLYHVRNDSAKVKRLLRRLVREASEHAITAWVTGEGGHKTVAQRIARELVP